MPAGLRRLGLALAAALAVVVLAGAFALSWFLNRDEVRAAVEAQIRAATGFDLVSGGKATVSIFPTTAVTLEQVGLRDASTTDPALTVDELSANLRLLPLLLRRFEIADVTLTRPHILVKRNASGGSNWTPVIRRLAQTLKPGASMPVSFSEIGIKDGEISYREEGNQTVETVTDVDLSLAWPSISRSFAATGQLDWRGQRIDGSINIADLVAALTGDRSGLRIRVSAAPLKAAFDGAMSNRSVLMAEGTLTADAPSLREALRWMGEDLPEGGFGRFALKARSTLNGSAIALTNVNVELDGNTAEGVISYGNDGHRTLQATLAGEALDFTPYANQVKLLASGAQDWNRQPFDLRSLSGIDLDMRLSAARVTIGNTKMGRTALGASIRGDTLNLSVGEVQLYGGLARGSLGIARLDNAANVKAQFQLVDVDLESALGELFAFRRLAGRGNLMMTLEAAGSSPFGLMQSLKGNVSLSGHDGALTGINIEQLLRRLERRPLSGAGDYRNGRTPFDKINASLRIDDGIAAVEDMRMDGSAVRLTVAGTASIPNRDFDMKGVASLLPSSTDAPASFELPFVLQGPWEDPLLFPDSDSLIRRSNAASPLLDAVRNRSGRDAVKSAIERLTGKSAPAAPPAAATPN